MAERDGRGSGVDASEVDDTGKTKARRIGNGRGLYCLPIEARHLYISKFHLYLENMPTSEGHKVLKASVCYALRGHQQ